MNIFDCHVNRTPCSGTVEEILYKPGKFFNASLDKASEDNERNYYKIKNNFGEEICLAISSILAVPKEETPNIVPNFSAAFPTPISPS